MLIAVVIPMMVVYMPLFFWLSWPDRASFAGTAVLAVFEAAETVIATAAYAALASRLFSALADRLAGPRITPVDPAAS